MLNLPMYCSLAMLGGRFFQLVNLMRSLLYEPIIILVV